MDYNQAVQYIHSCSHAGGHAGVLRILPLCEKLGSPQKKMKFIHVAGSSGKGSTAAMAESVLREAGFKTGLFMSPYVFDFRERLQINGELPDGQLIADALSSMLPALNEMKAEGRECTEFEVLCALAFTLFANQGCEWTVLEVGIGGRLDCTNVIDPPKCAVICNIGLDHTNLLGDTISKIAYEKCGIIKKGSSVSAYCDLVPDAEEVLLNTCKKADIKPRIITLSDISDLSVKRDGSSFTYKDTRFNLSMAGMHQVKNALNVIGVCEELNIPLSSAAKGIKNTALPGRFQTIRKEPSCILDGAHNPDKIAGVCETLDELYGGKRIITVFGMQKKKDYKKAIPELAKRSDVFIATVPKGVTEALPAETAAEIAGEFCEKVMICEDPSDAGALALKTAEKDDVVLATGSIYLLSDVSFGIMR